jgi:hypothetical protein
MKELGSGLSLGREVRAQPSGRLLTGVALLDLMASQYFEIAAACPMYRRARYFMPTVIGRTALCGHEESA